uniref:VWA domain-containing protein n=1 Tax=Klebsiella pneumoniae TaxID=573 RepID=UPI0021D1199C
VTLKMPAFEWVHVQLHQQKGMISLSPPTICNSADNSNFFAIDNFAHIKDEELYEKLLEEFKDWLGLAKKEGII